MDICDDQHDEIVFAGRHYPLCEALAERDDLEKNLNKTEEEIEKLEKGLV